MTTTAAPPEPTVTAKLSTLDRYLPVWIGVAMAAGLLLGRSVPDLNDGLDRIKVGSVSLPIAVAPSAHVERSPPTLRAIVPAARRDVADRSREGFHVVPRQESRRPPPSG